MTERERYAVREALNYLQQAARSFGPMSEAARVAALLLEVFEQQKGVDMT